MIHVHSRNVCLISPIFCVIQPISSLVSIGEVFLLVIFECPTHREASTYKTMVHIKPDYAITINILIITFINLDFYNFSQLHASLDLIKKLVKY